MIAEQLKKAVLQAAIQGKLTEQLSEDGDARDLLKDIQKEKARLVKEGKLKNEKPLPEISEDEIPFDIPENWVWARLGDITDYGVGKQVHPKYIPLNSWILELEDIEKDQLKVTTKRRDRIAGSSKNYFLPGDVLYGKLRPYLRKVIVADELGFCSTEIVPFNSFGCINKQYFKFYMVSPLLDFHINNITHGMDMPRLGTDKAKKLLVSIPPLAEQQRIVEKLDQVLTEIDNLALDENKLDKLEKAFPKKMKDAILQAAIQGKLTDQLLEDGNACDLLKEIQKEKARLAKEGKLKKEKLLPEITEDEIPFDIPENWVWVRLGYCCEICTGNSIPKHVKDSKYSNKIDGLPYIATKDVSFDNSIDYRNGVHIPYGELNFRIAPENSILLCIEGGSAGRKIGITNQNVCFGNKLCKFKPITVLPKFVFYYLQSSVFQSQFVSEMTGIIGGVGVNRINSLPIPIPTIDEQQRIVEKLDQLVPLLDRLE